MFNVRSSKNIKNSILEKVAKSFHFRSDNQRQITLDLSDAYKYRMRSISLMILRNFLIAISQACCEYNKQVWSRSLYSILLWFD
jgi:hypothetical protein